MTSAQGDLLHTVQPDNLTDSRIRSGKLLVWGAFAVLVVLFVLQALYEAEVIGFGFETWRPVLFGYFGWATALCISRVMIYGEQGKKALFVLPAALFVVSMVVFPLVFALWISFSDWNLASLTGRKFNGLDNVRQMWSDPFYWNAL